MDSQFVDLSTPPHVAGGFTTPTQADRESSNETASQDLPRTINVREQCDAIIAARYIKDETDSDAIDDNATSPYESPASAADAANGDDRAEWKNPCVECGSRYGQYHWERDNGLCERCSDEHGLSYVDEFHNCWVLQRGESLPPGCRRLRDVYPQVIRSKAPHQRAMPAAPDTYGVDTARTKAACRDHWFERRASGSLDREQAMRIAAMQDQRAFAAVRGVSDTQESSSVHVVDTQSQSADETRASSSVEAACMIPDMPTQVDGHSEITVTDAFNELRREHQDAASDSPGHLIQYEPLAGSSMSGHVEMSSESGESTDAIIVDAERYRPPWFCGEQWPR